MHQAAKGDTANALVAEEHLRGLAPDVTRSALPHGRHSDVEVGCSEKN